MSFLVAGTNIHFDANRFAHHNSTENLHIDIAGISIYIRFSEHQGAIVQKGDCVVAVLGHIEQCTAEQLLQRYLKEGIDVTTALFGSFIILIVHKERIFLIRDPIGTRTVYYKESGGDIAISTDPSFFSHHDNEKRLSLRMSYFLGGHLLTGTQYWGDTIQVQPGHWMSKLQNHMAQQVAFYSLPQKRQENGDFGAYLYQKTLHRVLADSKHVQNIVPQRNITSIVLLRALKEQHREVFLYGWEGDAFVMQLGAHFQMPVRLLKSPKSYADALDAAHWYCNAPLPEPSFLQAYILSTVLADKDVYFPFEESFGGGFCQQFLLLGHYFPKNIGMNYIRANSGTTWWDNTPKLARTGTILAQQIEQQMTQNGMSALEGAIRQRISQWAGMNLLPLYRAMFPKAHFPLFDERLVRIGLTLPLRFIVHKGKTQQLLWRLWGSDLPQEILALLQSPQPEAFVLPQELRAKAKDKAEQTPLSPSVQKILISTEDARMDRLLWYVLNY